MKLTRDVVVDLLPLYVAGEASGDTRALVEEFLTQDPELRRRAEESRRDALSGDTIASSRLPPDLELNALRRTRGHLRWQRLTYAWALTLTLLSLTSVFSFEGGDVHFRLLLLEYPRVFVPGMVLALSCWTNYFLLRRRVRAEF